MSLRARISGGVANCSRPSSAANSATPISIQDVTPVRNVPASQRAETSRLSGGRRLPPTVSGARHPDRDYSAPFLSCCSCRPFCKSGCLYKRCVNIIFQRAAKLPSDVWCLPLLWKSLKRVTEFCLPRQRKSTISGSSFVIHSGLQANFQFAGRYSNNEAGLWLAPIYKERRQSSVYKRIPWKTW